MVNLLSEDWAKALQFAEELPFSNLAKEAIYRHLVLIPKGFTQDIKNDAEPIHSYS
jgi:hypothetical protein